MDKVIKKLSEAYTQTSLSSFIDEEGNNIFVSSKHPVIGADLEAGGMFFLQVTVGVKQDNLIVSNVISKAQIVEKVNILVNGLK